MNRVKICIVLLLFHSFTAKAGYYIVNDKDGFVNVRQDKTTSAKVLYQLKNGAIVFCSEFEEQEDSAGKNWMSVQFYISQQESRNIKYDKDEIPDVMKGFVLVDGYVYKNRLIPLEENAELKKKMSPDQLLLYNDNIKIKFISGPFQKEKHKIQKTDEYGVFKIDGHYLVGTDGSMPREEIKSMTIEINKQRLSLSKNIFYDLYQPSFESTRAYVDPGKNLYIMMDNSDAAGSYTVIFIFRENKYSGRYIFIDIP